MRVSQIMSDATARRYRAAARRPPAMLDVARMTTSRVANIVTTLRHASTVVGCY